MDWYKDFKLVENDDGFTVEIYLNDNNSEFSLEFLSKHKETLLNLDDQIKKLVNEKFSDIKVTSVKLVVGSLIVASIPFAGAVMPPEVAGVSTITAQAATTQPIDYIAMSATGYVTADRLNMRSGPGTGYTVLHVLWQGNRVKVLGESGDWYKIQLSDGRTGWVSRFYFQIDGKQDKINTVISSAKSLLGTPYVWGGESLAEGGFDCSGLTQFVFKKVGYQLNRLSSDQAKQGIPVARANLQPGDLVFYAFNADGVINHVGIYIGNGKMIHSPKTGDIVKTTDITTSYWTTRFVTARRIIH